MENGVKTNGHENGVFEVTTERKLYVQRHHTVRLMEEKDTDQCVAILRSHGLPTAKYEIETFRKLNPLGCFVLTPEDDENQVIACVTTSSYDPRLGIIDHLGAKKGYQDLKLGLKIGMIAVTRLKDAKNVGCAACKEYADVYRIKAGFEITDKKQVMVFAKNGETDPSVIQPTEEEVEGIKVLPLKDVSWAHLMAYDNKVTGFSRAQLLSLSLHEPNTVSFVALDSNNSIIGYAAMKPSNIKGTAQLGPFIADAYRVAKVLLFNLLRDSSHLMSNGFLLSCLDNQTEGIRLAKKVGLQFKAEYPRLFTKEVLTGVQEHKVYAFLSIGHPYY